MREAFVEDYTQAFHHTEESSSLRSHQKGGTRNIFWTGAVLGGRCGKHCQACGHHRDAGRNTSLAR